MIIVSEENDYFKKYIERFNLKKHNKNELKEHKKETCKKVQGSLKGFNYLISVEEGCVFLKGNEVLLFKTNKNYIDFKITSNKVFYIDKPLYISNKILIKREAGNCFNVKIYVNKEGEEDVSLNVIFESSFSSNKKIMLKLKKRSHEL